MEHLTMDNFMGLIVFWYQMWVFIEEVLKMGRSGDKEDFNLNKNINMLEIMNII